MALFAICGPHASGKNAFVQTPKPAGLSGILRPDRPCKEPMARGEGPRNRAA